MAQFMMSMTPGYGGMQAGFNQPASANIQWTITTQERSNYDQQFNNLKPISGFLRGDQARNFFLQSNLPPPMLGQIWELADLTGDGKMDQLEFAIAMKLIKLKLQGVMLPMTLPPSMKQPAYGTSGIGINSSVPVSMVGATPNGTMNMGSTTGNNRNLQTSTSTLLAASSLSRHGSVVTETARSSINQEWSVPKASKLKYNQLFNTNDRTKSGYLSSMQARHILSGTGLQQITLATIWQLSDIDNDGKLSQDEFVLAMHLADMAKAGSPLPSMLPQHLIPPSYRTHMQQPSVQPNMGQLGLLTPLSAMDVNLKPPDEAKSAESNIFSTFEDKRRDNFQKGNLELEKRRLALLESQQKEKERLEQKEREAREKKEKERMEQERKRLEELERQLERQREVEREREEQRKKAIEQKEAAQREMERQRQLEWERIRRKELLQHKLREQELVTSLQAKTKTLDVELKSHQEKRAQLQERVKDVESRLKEHTEQLNAMNIQREQKQSIVQAQQQQMEMFNQQLNLLVPKKQSLSENTGFKASTTSDGSLQGLQRDYQSKVFTLQRLRSELERTESEKSNASNELQQLNFQLNHLREDLNKRTLVMESMNHVQQDKIRELQEARRQKDFNLTRKSSMEETKRHQEKVATDARLRRQESEKRLRREEELMKKRDLEEAEKERKRMREENERKRREEEAKKAEEEAKKAEVKRKIAEMQQERLKQLQQSKTATTSSGRASQLVLSKDPANLVKYRALYTFAARNPDELSINVGDVITVDQSQDAEPDWLAGFNNNNQSGWFPANYVEKISGPIVQPPPQSAKPTYPQPSSSEAPIQSSQPSAFSAATKSTSHNTFIKPPEVSQRYRAIYPWLAKKENHLTFSKDDIIAVSEKQEMWWYGHCKGKSGWFPKSYVKETSSTTPVNPMKPASPKSSPVLKRKAPAPPGGVAAATAKNYVASYTFLGTESGDLSFNAGDVIAVTNSEGEWWSGSLRGKSGIFPANYVIEIKPEARVEKVAASSQPTSNALSKPEVAMVIAPYKATGVEQLSLQTGQVVSVRKKNESGWWEGELQARGKKKQIGWFPANYVKLMTASSVGGKSTSNEIVKAPSSPKPAPSSRVMAMYDYSAQNPDELSFRRGDMIIVHDKSDPDWWKGTLGSASGLFPSNYVQDVSSNRYDSQSPGISQVSEYHLRVMELISSEEVYLKDLQLADEAFQQPLRDSKILSEQECNMLFVNLSTLIMSSAKLAKAFRVRCKMSGDSVTSVVIGDILCEQIPHLHPYIRFCSCQLNSSALLQEKLDNNPEFKAFVKKCESGDLWKGLPVSSYLVKPMQRITKYPLLIKKIIENTTSDHPDHRNLTYALEKAEELCNQVNEGVRQKENSDRLEWLQTHVQLDGLNDKLVFNSKTNCLDQRRFLHCGNIYKQKSNKELVGFLFNDFLLLTTPTKPLPTAANDKLFSSKSNPQFKIYKAPIFLNEVMIRIPPDAPEEPIFTLSHIEQVYILKAENVNERTSWVNKIKDATEKYIDTEKKKRERAYQARTQRSAGIGRLMVTIMEGCNLVKTSNGRHDPYCEVTIGEQCHTTKTVQDTLNPKWGSTMQFFIKDTQLDVLCMSVFQRDMFSPDDFLGRTEVKISDIQRETSSSKGPITKRLLLHEVDAGEIVVKLHLILFERSE